MKLIARIDFQPWWTRDDTVRNGPPLDPQHYADFVYAFVSRYGRDSRIGRVQAIQVWNEPNTTREWGGQPITRDSAADYVRLLGLAYEAAKAAETRAQRPEIKELARAIIADQTAEIDQMTAWGTAWYGGAFHRTKPVR